MARSRPVTVWAWGEERGWTARGNEETLGYNGNITLLDSGSSYETSVKI